MDALLRDFAHRTVVEVVPLAAVLRVGCVVAATEAAVVIADRVEVVERLVTAWNFVVSLVLRRNQDVLLLCFLVVRSYWAFVDQELTHVQDLREVHSCLVLLFAIGALVLKSLQMKDENLWSLVDLDDFLG